jgi:chromosome segregation ATPase
MPPIAEKFINVEQAAAALVGELENLKSETQHYSSAAASLETAGQRLGYLASETADLSARLREIVQALKEIGTPQLLGGLESLTERYSEHAVQLEALDRLIREGTEKTSAVSDGIQTVMEDLRQGYGETGASLKQVLAGLDRIDSTSIAAEQTTSQIASKLEALSAATEQRLQGLVGETTRLFQLARLTLFVAGAALGSSLAAFIYLLVTRR